MDPGCFYSFLSLSGMNLCIIVTMSSQLEIQAFRSPSPDYIRLYFGLVCGGIEKYMSSPVQNVADII